jgi:NAD(P)-dependent dehydrogenase (short-subunit alcohol dehydrogenase family)|tara:strand:- start:842 stop:1063 length:222 start_codon:yes stop_codon:yes gene_type:complete
VVWIAEAELGPIEIWVNAAMATVFGPVYKTSAAEFKRVTEVTYLGFVHGTLAALRYMEGVRLKGAVAEAANGS